MSSEHTGQSGLRRQCALCCTEMPPASVYVCVCVCACVCARILTSSAMKNLVGSQWHCWVKNQLQTQFSKAKWLSETESSFSLLHWTTPDQMCSRTTAVIHITDVFIMKHYHRLSASSQFSGSSQFFGITYRTPDLAKWYDVMILSCSCYSW